MTESKRLARKFGSRCHQLPAITGSLPLEAMRRGGDARQSRYCYRAGFADRASPREKFFQTDAPIFGSAICPRGSRAMAWMIELAALHRPRVESVIAAEVAGEAARMTDADEDHDLADGERRVRQERLGTPQSKRLAIPARGHTGLLPKQPREAR